MSATETTGRARGTPERAPTDGPGTGVGDFDAGTLRRDACRVLLGNWTSTSTVPSRTLYPHQWSWDSAFVAVGLRHLSPGRAQREVEALLGAQWGDGRIPHIVFNPAVPLGAYFPSPDFWRSSIAGAAAGAPATLETSGLVQPPVHALAAWLVHRADPELSRRRGFLARVHPRLDAWHRYLHERRDLGGHGLAAVLHPWEPGMDNSPCWDGPLARIEPADPTSFRRADLAHQAAADRPTDLDYGRYVRLAAAYRDAGYQDAAPHAFAVEDPGFNALLAVGEHALAEIAATLGHDPAVPRERASRLAEALLDRLWSPAAGQFLARDLNDPGDGASGGLLPARSAAGLLPLLLPELPPDIVEALVCTATGEHFALGVGTRLLPSYDLRGDAFERHRYWRGPAWFNVNWLLERGLREHGRTERADGLRRAMLEAAGASGFAEYLDPYTEAPRGAQEFSWTAALALDLLAGVMEGGHGAVPGIGERGAGSPARASTEPSAAPPHAESAHASPRATSSHPPCIAAPDARAASSRAAGPVQGDPVVEGPEARSASSAAAPSSASGRDATS